MKTTDQNRVNMVTTTSNVIDKDIWKEHEAFSDGVEALAERLGQIDDQLQIAPGNPGAKDLKESVRKSLCASACEVIGAVRGNAAKNDDPEITARVYAPLEIRAGKASDVVARCRTISTAASEIMTKLVKYGITAAKLVTFKKRIDAFDGVKVAPRQNRVKKSAAVQLLPQLVRDAGASSGINWTA